MTTAALTDTQRLQRAIYQHLRLAGVGGCSRAELAATLGVSKDTVRNQLDTMCRARWIKTGSRWPREPKQPLRYFCRGRDWMTQ